MGTIRDIRKLLLRFPQFTVFFAKLPWKEGKVPRSLREWDPASVEADSSRGRLRMGAMQLLHDGVLIDPYKVDEWRIEFKTSGAYGSGGVGSKSSSTGNNRSTIFGLVNNGDLVLVDRGRVRRVVGKRQHSSHLVQLRVTKQRSGRSGKASRLLVEFIVFDLPQAKTKHDRRRTTGSHRKVRVA